MIQRANSVSTPPAPSHVEAQRTLADADPVLAGLITRFGDCTLGATRRDPFATLCSAIIGQQISARAAATVEARLRAALDNVISPDTIAAATDDTLRAAGLSGAKVRYLRALSDAGDCLNLDELGQLDDRAVVQRLTAIHGIGPWTAEMFLIFVLNRPDVFSMGDVGLRNSINALYADGCKLDARATRAITDAWAPWRSIASWYLWRLADGDVSTWQ